MLIIYAFLIEFVFALINSIVICGIIYDDAKHGNKYNPSSNNSAFLMIAIICGPLTWALALAAGVMTGILFVGKKLKHLFNNLIEGKTPFQIASNKGYEKYLEQENKILACSGEEIPYREMPDDDE